MLSPSQQRLSDLLQWNNPPSLLMLFLESEQLDDFSLQQFRNHQWQSLTKMYLGINQLSMLDGLRECQFHALEELCLKNNRIASIEALLDIAMPSLKKLTLKSNKIVSVRCLRKANLPSLQHLSLENNPVCEVSGLSQLQNQALAKLELQFSNQPVLAEDVRWIFKLSTCHLQFMYSQSFRRIEITEVRHKVVDRWSKLGRAPFNNNGHLPPLGHQAGAVPIHNGPNHDDNDEY